MVNVTFVVRYVLATIYRCCRSMCKREGWRWCINTISHVMYDKIKDIFSSDQMPCQRVDGTQSVSGKLANALIVRDGVWHGVLQATASVSYQAAGEFTKTSKPIWMLTISFWSKELHRRTGPPAVPYHSPLVLDDLWLHWQRLVNIEAFFYASSSDPLLAWHVRRHSLLSNVILWF